MVQHATAAVSIAGSILLCLVFIGLVYDLIAGYSARRRFAKLLLLKKFWLRGKSCATAAPVSGKRPSFFLAREGSVGRLRTTSCNTSLRRH